MREGDYYPELRRANIHATTMTIHSSMDNEYVRDLSRLYIDKTIQRHTVEAVEVTMPRADWENIMEIYRSHYHAANQNPGVLDRWMEYRMMVALTER